MLLSLATRTVTFGSETQPIFHPLLERGVFILFAYCNCRILDFELNPFSGYWMRERKLFGVQV